MSMKVIAYDVGTTGLKACLFTVSRDEGIAYIASTVEDYGLQVLGDGAIEQNPDDWWQAVCHTVREVCRSVPGAGEQVAALALSVQGGTLAAVDRALRPVRPAIVWNDTRAARQQAEFIRDFGSAERMYQKTGWGLGPSLPAVMLRWLREEEPERFAEAKWFLTVPDYLSMKLTGKAVCDFSSAGINQLCDIRAAKYDAQLLAFAGVREEALAELARAGSVIGTLTADAAQALGLSEACLLVTGAHDQYAAALGAGALRGGDVFIGSGTCWVVSAICDEPDFSSGLAVSAAAVPGKWGALCSLPSGGVCLDWLRKSIASGEDGQALSYECINAEVQTRAAAEKGLFFYPFAGKCGKAGSLTRGSFVGLDLSDDRFDLARAVMEGVVFQTAWMLDGFRNQPGAEGIILSGGASRSPVWRQLLADALGCPVRIPEIADLPCVGAAILAGVGSGLYRDTEEGFRTLAPQQTVILPDTTRAENYRALQKTYRAGAEKLAELP